MLKNYFKIAWRNLRRNKAYTSINVLGLSLGIACCILIFTIISYHLSFDNFHPNQNRIYRIVSERHDEEVSYSEGVPQPLGEAFRTEFTFAEKTARVVSYDEVLITLTGEREVKKFYEEQGVAFAEPEFFHIFNFPLVRGNKESALKAPNTALVTERIAKKYFGNDNALGKTIRLENETDFVITGILKDIPPNTDRQHDIYLSYSNLADSEPNLANDNNWKSLYSSSHCFTLLKPGITAAQVNKAFPQIVNKYYTGHDIDRWKFRLQTLSDIHFNVDFNGYIDKKYLWALFFVGLFLITTACVNFINLATAQALNRSKEVGIRKVLGSLHSQLFWQFIAETAMITTFSVVLACGMVQLTLPWLNRLLESGMKFHLFSNLPLAAFLLSITVLVTFLSGSYPGLILARFQPILALKSKLSQKHIGGFSLRRILVVTQFAISQILIIGTIVIASQMRYARTTDLGFNKEAIIMLPVPEQDNTKMSTLRNRLATIPGVENISLCFQAPAANSNKSTRIRFDNRTEPEPLRINVKNADDQYLSTFGLHLVAGRNFFPSDTLRELLVNETFARKMHLSPREIIGKTVTFGSKEPAPVVGVVKDFYNLSFHSEISPVVIMPGNDNYFSCAVKINTKNIPAVLAAFEKNWNQVYPRYLYSYHFLDEGLKEFYELDAVLLKLVQAFALIAIVIGCLGLYGLVSFMAIRKTKEIGVRKVLGASVQNILWLFGKEFSRLLLVAFAIAAPFAWWMMHLYLQDFEYRIQIGAGIFLTAILSTFIVACVTIGYRSLRSALVNPVRSLRSE